MSLKKCLYLLNLTISFIAITPKLFQNNFVLAQVVPDRTLQQESSQVNSVSEQEQIIDGGAVRGKNLFHSFEEFNVKQDQAVNFTNPEGVDNIFSRVTGNNISQILGDLGVLGNANLFLLNPNGIVFGEKASLNLNGSFIATTANSINFANGFQFVADSANKQPLLTVNIPIGLQFDNQPGKIINQAQSFEKAQLNGQYNRSFSPAGLLVQSNRTIALIGGEIISEGGNITASGGNIELGGVGANSVVNFTLGTSNINFDYSLVNNFSDITLTNKEVFIRFPGVVFESLPSLIDANGDEVSGNINIVGKNISIINGSQVQALTFGDVTGGNVSIEAEEQLTINGRNFYNNKISIPSLISSSTTQKGDAGNIKIVTQKLIIEDFARIGSSSIGRGDGATKETTFFATGDGGNIIITASEIILENNAAIFSNSFGSGNAGNINLKTEDLSLNSNSQIAASTSSSDGGNINLEIDNNLELRNLSNISTSVMGDGNGGNINITTNFLITSPQDNSDIKANAEFGRGGKIKINASGIFGIDFQKSPTVFSDITASSDFGLDGTVALSNSEIQPDRTESDSQVQFVKVTPTFTPNYCYIGKQNQYIRTGRGGLPLAAKNSLMSEYTWEDWRIITLEETQATSQFESAKVQNQISSVKPVQGWLINQQGEIVLTADPISVTPYPSIERSPGC